MPCNGVAVATGRLAANTANLIAAMPPETLKNAIVTMLTRQFPQLAGKEVEPLPWRYDLGQTDLGFKIGRFLFEIQKDGKVTASVSRRSRADDRDITQAMQKAITDLLTGLAGMALQQQVIRQIKAAGYQVTGETRAPNGAIVLNVEV